MNPRRGGAFDVRKGILLVLGLVLVAYVLFVHIVLDVTVQRPQTAELATASSHKPENALGPTDNDRSTRPTSTRSYVPKSGRHYVWLDVAIDETYIGRVTIELYTDLVPKTAENFRVLTTGERGNEYTFKGSVCHRILKNFIVQCGDYTRGDGRGGRSIYGGAFDDEPKGLALAHSKRYLVQMANAGRNTNRSQFCFLLRPSPHLNGKHVVFGEVVEGFVIVDKMEEAGVETDGSPLTHTVRLLDGGELRF
ncbi:hypothetical protein PsorP6_009241 [Peronosclerospora sorghi]|uniref:Uncharacterized protein n=1 Tax=Peronosclerospora sorghi TaxID=230839 RepID=A0ACC0VYM4_9STRA|nr:hypothetical protein PsorP6_009241 [Peronosclerospora sorghi]